MSGWASMTERQRMEQLATDGGHHEWGWYVDDVPTLLAEIDRLREMLALSRYDGSKYDEPITQYDGTDHG